MAVAYTRPPTLQYLPTGSHEPRLQLFSSDDMPDDSGPMYFMALEGHPGFSHSILRAVVYSSREAADEQLKWAIEQDCIGYLPMQMKTSTTQLKVKELKLYTVDPDTQEIVTPGITSGYVN